jgi:hypothetical protein
VPSPQGGAGFATDQHALVSNLRRQPSATAMIAASIVASPM